MNIVCLLIPWLAPPLKIYDCKQFKGISSKILKPLYAHIPFNSILNSGGACHSSLSILSTVSAYLPAKLHLNPTFCKKSNIKFYVMLLCYIIRRV